MDTKATQPTPARHPRLHLGAQGGQGASSNHGNDCARKTENSRYVWGLGKREAGDGNEDVAEMSPAHVMPDRDVPRGGQVTGSVHGQTTECTHAGVCAHVRKPVSVCVCVSCHRQGRPQPGRHCGDTAFPAFTTFHLSDAITRVLVSVGNTVAGSGKGGHFVNPKALTLL